MNLHSRVDKLEKQSLLSLNIHTKNEVSAEWLENLRLKVESMEKQDLNRLLYLTKKRRDNNDRTEAEEAELEVLLDKYDIQGQTEPEREQT